MVYYCYSYYNMSNLQLYFLTSNFYIFKATLDLSAASEVIFELQAYNSNLATGTLNTTEISAEIHNYFSSAKKNFIEFKSLKKNLEILNSKKLDQEEKLNFFDRANSSQKVSFSSYYERLISLGVLLNRTSFSDITFNNIDANSYVKNALLPLPDNLENYSNLNKKIIENHIRKNFTISFCFIIAITIFLIFSLGCSFLAMKRLDQNMSEVFEIFLGIKSSEARILSKRTEKFIYSYSLFEDALEENENFDDEYSIRELENENEKETFKKENQLEWTVLGVKSRKREGKRFYKSKELWIVVGLLGIFMMNLGREILAYDLNYQITSRMFNFIDITKQVAFDSQNELSLLKFYLVKPETGYEISSDGQYLPQTIKLQERKQKSFKNLKKFFKVKK